MTAGLPHRPPGHLVPGGHTEPLPHRDSTSQKWFEHGSAHRVSTDNVIVQSLRAQYPNLHLTVVPNHSCNLLSFASSGNAGIAPIDTERQRLSWRSYLPPATRLNGSPGALGDDIKFAKYMLDWKGKEFVVYIADCRDGSSFYPQLINQYILSNSVEATNELVLEAGKWTNELHNEIWVYDGGFWQKSSELYDSMKKARWEDVILDKKDKDAIIEDVDNFFESRDTYERLRVPWKRGFIFYGPPGNGKTISIKAMMHTLYQREQTVPTLYVRTLVSFGGPEYSLAQIFGLARREAPCLLVFEDLDTIISENVRSYFLNEVDGIRRNDGILIVGSTNHLDRLDPGIAKRPSRFDRLYLFPNPDEKQRTAYLKFWQSKLSDNKDLEFPDVLCPAVAKITDKFSFAYIQEAMVASLLIIARGGKESVGSSCLECLEAHPKPIAGGSCDRETTKPFKGLYEFASKVRRVEYEDSELEKYVLWRVIKHQVRILREQMTDEESVRRRV